MLLFRVVSCSFTPASTGSLGCVTDQAVVREWVANAQRIVVLTGAGISTDSGIADYRGPQGVWTKNPEAEKQSDISQYVADADLRKASWRRRAHITGPAPQPNAGHRALVDFERSGRLLALVTQNVDGLHLAAGSDPALVVEVHGTTRSVACLTCGERGPMDSTLARVRAGEQDPACGRCGGILKAATISFGQALVPADLERADNAARRCDMLLAVGTTLGVFPVANMVPTAAAAGAQVVILNESPTAMDERADAVLRGSISDVLPALLA